MKTLHCDMCKSELVNPISGKTYWHIKEYDICEDCKDSLDFKLRPIVRAHFPYSQAWYEHELMGLVEKNLSRR